MAAVGGVSRAGINFGVIAIIFKIKFLAYGISLRANHCSLMIFTLKLGAEFTDASLTSGVSPVN